MITVSFDDTTAGPDDLPLLRIADAANRIQARRMRGSEAGRRGLSASSDRPGGSGFGSGSGSVSGRGSCGRVSSRACGLSAGRGGSGGSSWTTCHRPSAACSMQAPSGRCAMFVPVR